MKLKEWDERYQSGEVAFETPVPLVARMAAELPPGRALDVACGAGRNAIHLARLGWQVRAIDGSPAALDMLRSRAGSLAIEPVLLDLEQDRLSLEAESYDLVVDSYFLQRDLFPAMMRAVRPGGVMIAIVHLGEASAARRMIPGELRSVFEGWEVLHYREGEPDEACHRQPVAEIAARKKIVRMQALFG